MADDFEACFGIRPLEGYGTTETAPVVSVNVPDVEAGGVRQVGAKDGSIGHPIPGVAAKVVDLDTWEPLAPGKPGMLLVKGPNVMLGYLHEPARTREVMSDGWYVTGDIASIDEDGFVFIRDRISRFSKIGGEMVPHMAVEDEIARNCSLQAGSLVVTAVPDDRKGEQLVVLFTPDAGDAETLFNSLRDSSLPNLWKPRLDHFIMVETLPMLGSGKLDLRRIRELAAGRLGAGSIPAPGQQEGGT
jgi:acyl-[acyl-carrier-protein]-phospholipid O-acyltransferase/long-chain-fatty-acid--[acyl-carrier-protein] ligase